MRPYLLIFLLACGPTPPIGAPSADTDTNPSPGDDDDVTVPNGNDDEASLALFLWPPRYGTPQPTVAFGGVFVETRRGFVNLAQCVAFPDTYCAKELPDDADNWVDVFSFDEDLLDELLARDIGPSVTLGSYEASKLRVGALEVYFDPAAGGLPTAGAGLDLAFGPGEWGTVAIEDAIQVPTPLEITSPETFTWHTFTDTAPVPFRWTPGGTGEVYLSILAAGNRRLYLLEDDGSFDLDLGGLGLFDAEEISIALSRWTTANVDIDGHELALQVQYDQWFYGAYRDLTGTELVPADTCQDAMGDLPVVPGTYWGTLDGFSNDLNPGNGGCTGFAATGQDAVIPYVMQPWEFLTVTQGMPGDDASVYLLTQCQDTTTCLDGSDSAQAGANETVTWFNQTDAELPLYIVVDSFGLNDDVFELSIDAVILETDLLVPTCIEAMQQGPAAPGIYTGYLGSNNNILDPTIDCDVSAPGGEGLVQILLQPGETLTATASMPGSDTVLYVLYNCSVVASCAETRDASTTASETISYTNASLGSEIVYLVVDAAGPTGQYIVDIEIN